MTHYDYDPKNLPATSSIQVFVLGQSINKMVYADNKFEMIQIDLNGSETIFTLDEHYANIVSKSVVLTGENAEVVCNLWRQLPKSEPARCHMPVFGLYLIAGTQIHTIASICWQCDNIVLMENGERQLYGFNSHSEAGQQLFQLLTTHTESA
jgi:hypothetical protein